MQKLNQYRSEIDNIDEQIQELLTERAKTVLKIFEEKKKNNIPIYDPKREITILKTVANCNKGPLSNESLATIYQAIFAACRALAK